MMTEDKSNVLPDIDEEKPSQKALLVLGSAAIGATLVAGVVIYQGAVFVGGLMAPPPPIVAVQPLSSNTPTNPQGLPNTSGTAPVSTPGPSASPSLTPGAVGTVVPLTPSPLTSVPLARPVISSAPSELITSNRKLFITPAKPKVSNPALINLGAPPRVLQPLPPPPLIGGLRPLSAPGATFQPTRIAPIAPPPPVFADGKDPILDVVAVNGSSFVLNVSGITLNARIGSELRFEGRLYRVEESNDFGDSIEIVLRDLTNNLSKTYLISYLIP